MSYNEIFKKQIDMIQAKLEEILPVSGRDPSFLNEEMNYAVFSGGKRFRPVMALSACKACGGEMEDALIPAVALELIHCYSLVHDDLPALDNDDVRRGQPTVHKKYGEDIAILTGDGLLTYAFQLLATMRDAEKAVLLIREISMAVGTYGMIGGQVADLRFQNEEIDLPMLDFINVHKTGKLLWVSALTGAISASADQEKTAMIHSYGELMGLAFQAVDDLLDGDGYLKVMKASEVKANVRDLIARAKKSIKGLGVSAEDLMSLADVLLDRIPMETVNNHD